MTVPLNRVIAFCGPYVSIVAGAVAAWLVAKLNVLGIPGLDEANVATWIAAALTAGLTAGLSHLGQWSWLKGHHILLEAAAYDSAPPDVKAAAGLTTPVKDPTTGLPVTGTTGSVTIAASTGTVPPDADNSVLQATDGDATEPVAPDPASGSRVNVAKEPQPFEEPTS